ncbi:MAG: nucleotidyltransferase family protein [Bacillota bacterium]|nr:nucleotidyltransferase family protein [Bacillota bacterium]
MNVLGITAEYNPFHNGHAYHLEKSKELASADISVAVMSGNFTQRGEPAMADKWIRSRDAVKCGVDVVFELPFIFACNRAPVFAAGGVDALIRAGATHISFGCESKEPAELSEAARRLCHEEAKLNVYTTRYMMDGLSHARAYDAAVEYVIGKDTAALLRKPNNILAVEYLKRMDHWREKGVDVVPLPVTRKGSGYHDVNADGGYAGASAIREIFRAYMEGDEGSLELFKTLVPAEVAGWMCDQDTAKEACGSPGQTDERYYQILKALLVRSTPKELAQIYCVGEGIENKMVGEIIKANDLQTFMDWMVSKRYTAAAVRRLMVYILMGIDRREGDMLTDTLHTGMPYLRVLAASDAGRSHIKSLKEQDVPVITNVNKQRPVEHLAGLLLDLDIKASDMYNVISGRSLYDYSDKVVRPYIEP